MSHRSPIRVRGSRRACAAFTKLRGRQRHHGRPSRCAPVLALMIAMAAATLANGADMPPVRADVDDPGLPPWLLPASALTTTRFADILPRDRYGAVQGGIDGPIRASARFGVEYIALRVATPPGATTAPSRMWVLVTTDTLATPGSGGERLPIQAYAMIDPMTVGPVFWPEDPAITGPQRWLHPARPAPVAATAPSAVLAAHLRGLARSASVALPASWQAHAVFARFARYRQDDDAGDDPPPVGRWLVAWTVPEGPVVGLWTVDPLTGAARIVFPPPTPSPGP